jgi:hypothetical protein
MPSTVIGKINRLREMTVGELREQWFKLYGEPTRSRNRTYLWRRLAWRIQELEYGGLSGAAKARLEELGYVEFRRARTPGDAIPDAASSPRRRDPRLPAPGTVITKVYKGRELRVTVRDDGLELGGTMYPTATALAKTVTDSKSINGWLFLGITKRKRS